MKRHTNLAMATIDGQVTYERVGQGDMSAWVGCCPTDIEDLAVNKLWLLKRHFRSHKLTLDYDAIVDDVDRMLNIVIVIIRHCDVE